MEKADNVYVECVDFAWSDLGTWSSLYDNSPKTVGTNVTRDARFLAYEAEGNIVAVPSGKLVVMDGLSDYIVADTGDVLLICPKSQEQRIRQVVTDVRLKFGEDAL